MKIKYVGLKQDGETAFADKTGITWMPGDSREIADAALCKRMLQHPDVFAEDTGEAADGTLKDGPARTSIKLTDGTLKELAELDKDALHALAAELQVKVHHAAGAAKVLEALFAAFPE